MVMNITSTTNKSATNKKFKESIIVYSDDDNDDDHNTNNNNNNVDHINSSLLLGNLYCNSSNNRVATCLECQNDLHYNGIDDTSSNNSDLYSTFIKHHDDIKNNNNNNDISMSSLDHSESKMKYIISNSIMNIDNNSKSAWGHWSMLFRIIIIIIGIIITILLCQMSWWYFINEITYNNNDTIIIHNTDDDGTTRINMNDINQHQQHDILLRIGTTTPFNKELSSTSLLLSSSSSSSSSASSSLDVKEDEENQFKVVPEPNDHANDDDRKKDEEFNNKDNKNNNNNNNNDQNDNYYDGEEEVEEMTTKTNQDLDITDDDIEYKEEEIFEEEYNYDDTIEQIKMKERIRQRPRNLRIIFVGDSITRYQYLSLIYYLKYGYWYEYHHHDKLYNNNIDEKNNLMNSHSFHHPLHTDNDWNEFFLQSNSVFYPNEACDCVRSKDGKIIVERRYYYDSMRNNRVTYINMNGNKVNIGTSSTTSTADNNNSNNNTASTGTNDNTATTTTSSNNNQQYYYGRFPAGDIYTNFQDYVGMPFPIDLNISSYNNTMTWKYNTWGQVIQYHIDALMDDNNDNDDNNTDDDDDDDDNDDEMSNGKQPEDSNDDKDDDQNVTDIWNKYILPEYEYETASSTTTNEQSLKQTKNKILNRNSNSNNRRQRPLLILNAGLHPHTFGKHIDDPDWIHSQEMKHVIDESDSQFIGIWKTTTYTKEQVLLYESSISLSQLDYDYYDNPNDNNNNNNNMNHSNTYNNANNYYTPTIQPKIRNSDIVMCNILKNCYNISWTAYIKSEYYYDDYHFVEPIYRTFNEQLLQQYNLLPKHYGSLYNISNVLSTTTSTNPTIKEMNVSP